MAICSQSFSRSLPKATLWPQQSCCWLQQDSLNYDLINHSWEGTTLVCDVVNCLTVLPPNRNVCFLVRLSRCRLIHDFSLFGQAEVVTDKQFIPCCIIFSVLALRAQLVIRKQDVSDDSLFLCSSLQAPEVEPARRQSCIWPVFRLGSDERRQSPWPRILYWRASEREHSLILRCSLLESILTRLRHVQNFNHHAFVKLSYGRYEFAGTAKRLLCLPQTVSAYRIESLGQVSKGHKEVAILLLAFFTYSRGGNRSVVSQVKRELNHFHWSKSVRYFLCSEYRLTYQLVRAE